MDGEQFKNWCLDNWSPEITVLEACNIDQRTLKRWRKNGPPNADLATNALRYWRGDLRLWEGWRINDRAELCSPENLIFTPGILRARQYELEITRSLRCELRTLKKQIVVLKTQLSQIQLSRKAANDPRSNQAIKHFR